MKKIDLMVVVLSSGLLAACGGETKQETVNNKYDTTVQVVNTEPLADMEQTTQFNVKLGAQEYLVKISRYPNKKLPLVVDELDQKFYDNCVDLEILSNGVEIFKRNITKEDFKSLLSDNDFKNGLLLGMNCDTARCHAGTLCFTAQVGQVGEGPAFLYLVPTGGGEVKISRDNQQDEIGYQKEAE